MAYFSNGSEATTYVAHYCDHCQNYRDLDDGRGFGCAVWDLHMQWNYEQLVDGERTGPKHEALAHFIPEAEDGHPGDCTMYLDDEKEDPGPALPFGAGEKGAG